MRERKAINYAAPNSGSNTPAWLKVSKPMGVPSAGDGQARRSLTDNFSSDKGKDNKHRDKKAAPQGDEEEEPVGLSARLAKRQPLGDVSANANDVAGTDKGSAGGAKKQIGSIGDKGRLSKALIASSSHQLGVGGPAKAEEAARRKSTAADGHEPSSKATKATLQEDKKRSRAKSAPYPVPQAEVMEISEEEEGGARLSKQASKANEGGVKGKAAAAKGSKALSEGEGDGDAAAPGKQAGKAKAGGGKVKVDKHKAAPPRELTDQGVAKGSKKATVPAPDSDPAPVHQAAGPTSPGATKAPIKARRKAKSAPLAEQPDQDALAAAAAPKASFKRKSATPAVPERHSLQPEQQSSGSHKRRKQEQATSNGKSGVVAAVAHGGNTKANGGAVSQANGVYSGRKRGTVPHAHGSNGGVKNGAAHHANGDNGGAKGGAAPHAAGTTASGGGAGSSGGFKTLEEVAREQQQQRARSRASEDHAKGQEQHAADRRPQQPGTQEAAPTAPTNPAATTGHVPSGTMMQQQKQGEGPNEALVAHLLKPLSPATLAASSQSKAFEMLQGQYVQLQDLYQQLKAQKISQLEGLLDEQDEYVDALNTSVTALAQHWREEAEHQMELSKKAGAQETLDKLETLEEENLAMKGTIIDHEVVAVQLRIQLAEKRQQLAAACTRADSAVAAEQQLRALLLQQQQQMDVLMQQFVNVGGTVGQLQRGSGASVGGRQQEQEGGAVINEGGGADKSPAAGGEVAGRAEGAEGADERGLVDTGAQAGAQGDVGAQMSKAGVSGSAGGSVEAGLGVQAAAAGGIHECGANGEALRNEDKGGGMGAGPKTKVVRAAAGGAAGGGRVARMQVKDAEANPSTFASPLPQDSHHTPSGARQLTPLTHMQQAGSNVEQHCSVSMQFPTPAAPIPPSPGIACQFPTPQPSASPLPSERVNGTPAAATAGLSSSVVAHMPTPQGPATQRDEGDFPSHSTVEQRQHASEPTEGFTQRASMRRSSESRCQRSSTGSPVDGLCIAEGGPDRSKKRSKTKKAHAARQQDPVARVPVFEGDQPQATHTPLRENNSAKYMGAANPLCELDLNPMSAQKAAKEHVAVRGSPARAGSLPAVMGARAGSPAKAPAAAAAAPASKWGDLTRVWQPISVVQLARLQDDMVMEEEEVAAFQLGQDATQQQEGGNANNGDSNTSAGCAKHGPLPTVNTCPPPSPMLAADASPDPTAAPSMERDLCCHADLGNEAEGHEACLPQPSPPRQLCPGMEQMRTATLATAAALQARAGSMSVNSHAPPQQQHQSFKPSAHDGLEVQVEQQLPHFSPQASVVSPRVQPDGASVAVAQQHLMQGLDSEIQHGSINGDNFGGIAAQPPATTPAKTPSATPHIARMQAGVRGLLGFEVLPLPQEGAFEYTHFLTGMKFQLCPATEDESQDSELQSCFGDSSSLALINYRPLSLGTAKLPAFLHSHFQFAEGGKQAFMNQLWDAVKH